MLCSKVHCQKVSNRKSFHIRPSNRREHDHHAAVDSRDSGFGIRDPGIGFQDSSREGGHARVFAGFNVLKAYQGTLVDF